MNHTTIIGFGHKARQGKDEAARLLEVYGAGKVRRFSFADALYAICRVHHGMRGKDPMLLQDIGFAYRMRDPGVWVRACVDAIEAWDAEATGPQVAVITDVRFKNEAGEILARGGHLVRVRRWLNGNVYVSPDRPANHPSEIDLEDYQWPHTIENHELPEFRQDVRTLASSLVPSVFTSRCKCRG